MQKVFAGSALLFLATALTAAPVIPGNLHIVEAKDGNQEVKDAQVNDVVEIRINNPVLAKRVSDVVVDATADAVLAGVVNGSDPKLIGGGWISIIVRLKSPARSGMVAFSYKDGDGKEHKGTVVLLSGTPVYPTENKDFPAADSLFVPFYVTDGMIEKKMDLYASTSNRGNGEPYVGLIDAKTETVVKKMASRDKELFLLANLSQLPRAGWYFAAFPKAAKETQMTRLTTAAKVSLIDKMTIAPDEASTEFTISYAINIDSKTTCTATSLDSQNQDIEIQGETTRKQGTDYKAKWDAGGAKPGRYGIRLTAVDLNDENVFDQRNAWRQAKKR